MKRNEKAIFLVFIIAFAFGLGIIVGNNEPVPYEHSNTVVENPVMEEAKGICQSNVPLDFCHKLVLHHTGTAVFDLPDSLKYENEVSHDQKKKNSILKNQMVNVIENKVLKTNDVLKNVKLVVDTMFRDQQLWVSANADTIFVSTEHYSMWHLIDAVELKKRFPDRHEVVFAEKPGTLFRTTIEDSDLGKSRIDLFRLFSEKRLVNNRKEHFFYCDTADVAIYGQVLENGDTVIISIKPSNHVASNNSAVNKSNVVNNDELQVEVADSGLVQPNDIVNDSNSTIQLDESNQALSQETVVKDDLSKTEEAPVMKHQKVKKNKKLNDNEIVKHNHKKLKKEKKENKKKKSKEAIEFHF